MVIRVIKLTGKQLAVIELTLLKLSLYRDKGITVIRLW